jgi:hypothetical protein
VDPNRGLPPHRTLFQLGQRAPAHGRVVLVRDVGEAHRRDEVLRLPRLGALGVQLVDLLEGEAFGLVDEEVYECDADDALWWVVSRCSGR